MKTIKKISVLLFASLLVLTSCKNAEEIKKRELAEKLASQPIQIISVVKPDNLGEINKISVDEFDKVIQEKNVQLVDVRTPEEYAEGHIKGAVNINFKKRTFPDFINVIDKKKPVAIYCRSANRSGKAALIMQSLGFKKIYDLDGGIKAWKAAGKELSADNNATNQKIQKLIEEKKAELKGKPVVGKNHQIGVADFEKLVKDGKVTLVDVRTPKEFAQGHIEGAINVDWKNRHFADNITKVVGNDKPAAIYCRSGNRATRAMYAMDALGYNEVYNLEHGIKSWKAENKPLKTLEVKGDKHHLDVVNFNNAIQGQVGKLIDIRTAKEYDAYHIPGAINIDFKKDNFKEEMEKVGKDVPVLIYCRSGGRSGRATKMLSNEGFDVYNLNKGILKWKEKGMPIEGKDTSAHDGGEEGC
jgi:rhodanese-related sulfurtransferase